MPRILLCAAFFLGRYRKSLERCTHAQGYEHTGVVVTEGSGIVLEGLTDGFAGQVRNVQTDLRFAHDIFKIITC